MPAFQKTLQTTQEWRVGNSHRPQGQRATLFPAGPPGEEHFYLLVVMINNGSTLQLTLPQEIPSRSLNTHLALTGRRSEEGLQRSQNQVAKSKGESFTVSLNCACDEVQRPLTCYSHSTLSRRPKEDTIVQDRCEHGHRNIIG